MSGGESVRDDMENDNGKEKKRKIHLQLGTMFHGL